VDCHGGNDYTSSYGTIIHGRFVCSCVLSEESMQFVLPIISPSLFMCLGYKTDFFCWWFKENKRRTQESSLFSVKCDVFAGIMILASVSELSKTLRPTPVGLEQHFFGYAKTICCSVMNKRHAQGWILLNSFNSICFTVNMSLTCHNFSSVQRVIVQKIILQNFPLKILQP
jgi:hypothetical protein